ncbi:hypothetical protein PO909_029102 [Leuciscus waleckii]
MDVFKRRKPLTFSPTRQYGLAVISPLQKQDSRETVFADNSSSGTSSPAHSNDPYEGNPYEGNPYEGNPYEGNPYEGIPFEGPSRRSSQRWWTSYCVQQPFSFDERDSRQRVQRERRLQEMRQRQEQQWSSTFKAHPVRRYKPLIQPMNHSETRSQQSE